MKEKLSKVAELYNIMSPGLPAESRAELLYRLCCSNELVSLYPRILARVNGYVFTNCYNVIVDFSLQVRDNSFNESRQAEREDYELGNKEH